MVPQGLPYRILHCRYLPDSGALIVHQGEMLLVYQVQVAVLQATYMQRQQNKQAQPPELAPNSLPPTHPRMVLEPPL